MLDQEEIKKIFAEANAIIINDHFVYAKKADGWYHGSDYVNKDAIYPYTHFVSQLCEELARHFINEGVAVVVGPTVGAVSLAQWTAHHRVPALAVCADEEDVLEQKETFVNCDKKVVAFGEIVIDRDVINRIIIKYFEKVGTRRVIKRGYEKLVKDKRCLIVEDVINSGITVEKTRDAVIQAGGEVIGVGALCNRSGGKVTAETLKVPELFSLLDVNMEMFPEDECPICKERGPESVRIDIGKGKEFLTRKGLV